MCLWEGPEAWSRVRSVVLGWLALSDDKQDPGKLCHIARGNIINYVTILQNDAECNPHVIRALHPGEIWWNLTVKTLPAMQETWVWSLGQERPLEEGMASFLIHSLQHKLHSHEACDFCLMCTEDVVCQSNSPTHPTQRPSPEIPHGFPLVFPLPPSPFLPVQPTKTHPTWFEAHSQSVLGPFKALASICSQCIDKTSLNRHRARCPSFSHHGLRNFEFLHLISINMQWSLTIHLPPSTGLPFRNWWK